MTDLVPLALTALGFALWIGLLGFRGGFWLADQRLDEAPLAAGLDGQVVGGETGP